MPADAPSPPAAAADTTAGFGGEVRPHPDLLRCWAILALPSNIVFPIVMLAAWLRYRSIRYRFDDDGVSMASGILHRREVYLAYRRIQDIQVSRNVVERWFGLATLALQTASGSADAEMRIVGIKQPDRLRDHLYARMRGARDEGAEATESRDGGEEGSHARAEAQAEPADETLAVLEEIRDLLRERIATTAPAEDGARDREAES